MAVEGHPAMQNGNERGGACSQQGIWKRVGEEASRTEQEWRGSSSSAPARASARNRRVFLSLDFGIVPYFSPEFSGLMCCFFSCTYSVVCFKLKSSRRLFFCKARIIWYYFFFGSGRSLSDLRTVVNSWNWNIEHLRYSYIAYIIPSSQVFPSSWWTMCWMDGVETPQAEPPCRGGRSPKWRTKTAANAGGRCCFCVGEVVILFLSVYFWFLNWLLSKLFGG